MLGCANCKFEPLFPSPRHSKLSGLVENTETFKSTNSERMRDKRKEGRRTRGNVGIKSTE